MLLHTSDVMCYVALILIRTCNVTQHAYLECIRYRNIPVLNYILMEKIDYCNCTHTYDTDMRT